LTLTEDEDPDAVQTATALGRAPGRHTVMVRLADVSHLPPGLISGR
jgi:hypothetical protein